MTTPLLPCAPRFGGLAIAALIGLWILAAAGPPPAAAGGGPRPCIVLLRDGPDAGRMASRIPAGRLRHVYRSVRGLAADLDDEEIRAVLRDPRVRGVYPDGEVSLPSAPAEILPTAPAGRGPLQTVPTGVARCGALASSTARLDGLDTPLDVDVAVIDTGIDSRHPDLNVVGGYSVFRTGGHSDPHGHGTHVAGTIAARDNGFGVVGVAPGARLWSVRVLNRNGRGRWSDVIAGLDWVAEHSDVLDVANMSIAGGIDDEQPLREAVDACVERGVTVVVAAGNDSLNVDLEVPCRFESVITVSALADRDGAGGPSSGRFRVKGRRVEEDESFAWFSNFGAKVHLIAPGVRILSTFRNRRYAVLSGTSQASPHAAGAAALYRAANPGATPAQVRDALILLGSRFEPLDDPDGIHEPALDVSGL